MTTQAEVRPTARRAPSGAAVREVIGAGIVAGLLGGVLMRLWGMIYTAAIGVGFWAPARAIAATFLGVDALIGGGGVVLFGIALHMITSMFWGVFGTAALGREVRRGPALALGLIGGLVVLAIMTWIVMPVIDRVMLDRVRLRWGMWIIGHLLFGVGLAFAPALRRRICRPA